MTDVIVIDGKEVCPEGSHILLEIDWPGTMEGCQVENEEEKMRKVMTREEYEKFIKSKKTSYGSDDDEDVQKKKYPCQEIAERKKIK